MEKLLTTREVAKRLNCSQVTVRDLINRGELEHYQLLYRIRVSENDLDNFLQNHRNRCVKVRELKPQKVKAGRAGA